MRILTTPLLAIGLAALSACTTVRIEPQAAAAEPSIDQGVLWAKHAVEYRAVTTQVYAQAGRDLASFIADTSWSALPGRNGEADKPVAIILDMDETIVSGANFQITELPYTSYKHYVWSRDTKAVPVPGAPEFLHAATDAGVEIFYLTNRPCKPVEGADGYCPQEKVAIDDIREIGLAADAEHVLLANEQPGWGKEKFSRRDYIGQTHRVIMLFGDDYGDFVFCTRAEPVAPCTTPATRATRAAALETYKNYWGHGWYILPNPMHGSWTTVR